MPNFQFSRRAKWPWRDKILGAPQRGQKIIVNQSKPILVIVSIKPFTCQSSRQNYFSREFEWAVFTETALFDWKPVTEKYNFKDVLLAWSRFLTNTHQEPLILWLLSTHNCSIPDRKKKLQTYGKRRPGFSSIACVADVLNLLYRCHCAQPSRTPKN